MKMAGVKYALTKRDTLEQEERRADRSRNNYYIDRPVALTLPDGTIKDFGPGWERLNDREVASVAEATGKNMVPEKVFLESARKAAELAKAKAGVPGYDKSTSKLKVRLSDKFEFELPVRYPKPGTVDQHGNPARPILMMPGQLVGRYEEAIAGNNALMHLANMSSELVGQADQTITGFQGMVGRLMDMKRAYFDKAENFNLETRFVRRGNKVSEELVVRGKGELSDVNKYNTYLRLLAVQMAPLLLGESGKTISDRDRKLVADALGLQENDSGMFTWAEGSSLNQGLLQERLGLIKNILRESRENVDGNYRRIWGDFGIDPESKARETQEARTRAQYTPGVGDLIRGEDGVFNIVGTS